MSEEEEWQKNYERIYEHYREILDKLEDKVYTEAEACGMDGSEIWFMIMNQEEPEYA